MTFKPDGKNTLNYNSLYCIYPSYDLWPGGTTSNVENNYFNVYVDT